MSARRLAPATPPALALLDDEARWLGIGFVNLLHLYSPEMIVVGGGVGQLLDLLLPGIRREIEARAMIAYRRRSGRPG